MEPITKITQVEKLYTDCMSSIQEKISSSNIDTDTKILLDSVSQQTAYVLSGIIEYLKNQ